MQAAEIELKFSVDDVSSLRRAVAEAGFRLKTERSFESNTLYDTPDRQLREKKQILRLRDYAGRCVLTHKRQPLGTSDLRYKTRLESESVVEDGAALAEIFTQLGYRPVFRYEKYRTEWESGDGHLVLDETPIGVWAELEGEPEWIDAILDRLGVAAERCSTESYGKMFLRWRAETGSPAENLTFEEVAAVGAGVLAAAR